MFNFEARYPRARAPAKVARKGSAIGQDFCQCSSSTLGSRGAGETVRGNGYTSRKDTANQDLPVSALVETWFVGTITSFELFRTIGTKAAIQREALQKLEVTL